MDRSNIPTELNTGEGLNHFKYKSFSSRVESLKITATRRTALVEESVDDRASYFQEAFNAWKDLNSTRHFKNFMKEISPYVGALPTILYNKDHIVDILEKYLLVQNSLALDALLDLCVKIAQDLESEFYPYFFRMLACILPLSHIRDVPTVENVFNSITFLFKFLRRQLLTDLCPTFSLLTDLLGKKGKTKPYIQHFVAEAFAFLIRKSRGKDFSDLVGHIISSLLETPTDEYNEGLSMLFFEYCKQVGNHLHSKAPVLYKELICRSYDQDSAIDSIEKDPVQKLLRNVTVLLLHHAHRPHFSPICEVVLDSIDKELKKGNVKKLAVLMDVLVPIVTVRKASRVEDMKPIVARLQGVTKLIFTRPYQPEQDHLYRQALLATTSTLLFGSLEVVASGSRLILENVMSLDAPHLIDSFFLGMAIHKWSNFTQILIPYMVRYTSQHLTSRADASILLWSNVLSSDVVVMNRSMLTPALTDKGKIRFLEDTEPSFPTVLINTIQASYDWKKELEALQTTSDEHNKAKSMIPVLAAALGVLPCVHIDTNTAWSAVNTLVVSLTSHLPKLSNQQNIVDTDIFIGRPPFPLKCLLGLALETLARLSSMEESLSMGSLFDTLITNILATYGDNEVVLRGAFLCLERIRATHVELFSTEHLSNLYTTLKSNLDSYHHQDRLYTLKILGLFEQPQLKKDSQHSEDSSCDIVPMASDIEASLGDVKDVRNAISLLKKLSVIVSSGRIPADFEDLVPRYCFGLLTVNLQPLWKEARACLVVVSNSNRKLFWALCMSEISRFEDNKQLIRDEFSPDLIMSANANSSTALEKITKTGEISFGCPTLSRFVHTESNAYESLDKDTRSFLLLFVKHCKQEYARMDFDNWFRMILQALKEMRGVVDKHAEEISSLFLKFIKKEYNFEGVQYMDDDEADDDEETKEEKDKPTEAVVLSISSSNTKKLLDWLGVVGIFSNMQNIHRSQELWDVYQKLLSSGDRAVQKAALACAFTFRDKGLKPYADNLRNLLDDNSFRDELSTLCGNEDMETIDPTHRAQVVPIIMRILYGRLVQHKARAAGRLSKEVQRKAILGALSNCNLEEFGYFIGIVLGRFMGLFSLQDAKFDENGKMVQFELLQEGRELVQAIPQKVQIGFLHLLGNILKTVNLRHLPLAPKLFKVLLYVADANVIFRGNDMDIDEELLSMVNKTDKRGKDIRSVAVKRLVEFFSRFTSLDFEAYIPALFKSLISPRLPQLPGEASHNVSALLTLFSVWASTPKYTAFLSDYDDQLLPQLFAILSATKLDEQVLSMVLSIIETLLDQCDVEMEMDDVPNIKDRVIVPHVDLLISYLGNLIQVKGESKESHHRHLIRQTARQTAVMARLALYAKDGEQAVKILDLLLPNLRKSSRAISEAIKGSILSIWNRYIPIVPNLHAGSPTFTNYVKLASASLLVVPSQKSRTLLVDLFEKFSHIEPQLVPVHSYLAELNAVVTKQDKPEPNFNRIVDALNSLADDGFKALNPFQWLPILHQLLYLMKHPQEMAIRSTASHCVCLFISEAKLKGLGTNDMVSMVIGTVFPAIKRALSIRNELIRSEFVSVLNTVIKTFPELPTFADLVALASEDVETNFFDNIYHMQVHQRIQALQRLVEVANTGSLRVPSIQNVLLPMVSILFYETDRAVDSTLVHECVQTVGALCKYLPWGNYYRQLKYYTDMIQKMPNFARTSVRIVVAILDSFHFDLSQVVPSESVADKVQSRYKATVESLSKRKEREEDEQAGNSDQQEEEEEEEEETEKDTPANDPDNEAEEDNENENENEDEHVQGEEEMKVDEDEEKGQTTSQAERIHDTLMTVIVPKLSSLLDYARAGSREVVIQRLPLSLGIIRLLLKLSEKSRRVNLPGLLIVLCETIRSRSQAVRESVRDILLKASTALGPTYFSTILKDLRFSLTKGYELYVLGYTVNVLLSSMIPQIQVGDLDYCLRDIMAILMEDIFGMIGRKKDEDEVSKNTKEARSRLSASSIQLLPSIISFDKMDDLLLPLKDIMGETTNVKILNKVDELLRRIATGLVRNPKHASTTMLDFSSGLITENLEKFKMKITPKKEKSQMEKNFEVQIRRPVGGPGDHYRANAYRFIYFGLNLLRSCLKSKKIDVEENADTLNDLLPVLFNVLYSTQDDNVTMALKILAMLSKYQLASLPDLLPQVIKRCVQLINASGSTESEMARSCVRLLTIVLEDPSMPKLSEPQLVYLLTVIRSDLEQVERQAAVYTFVRVILRRKFMAPEVYDLMDHIARIMITNQTREIRNQARDAYFMFLMDYPQGKSRLKTQVTFLVKNLEYEHESGRLVVMDVLYQLLEKCGPAILSDFVNMIFMALVLRLINDDSSTCRETSAELIRVLIQQHEDYLPTMYRVLDKWLVKTAKLNLQRTAWQVYGLVTEARGAAVKPQVATLTDRLEDLLASAQADENETPWEVVYYALNTWTKLLQTFPTMTYNPDTVPIWTAVMSTLLYHHAWVRTAIARLVGVYFGGAVPETRSQPDSDTPLDLLNVDRLVQLAGDFVTQLKSLHLHDSLADQIVKNLFFIGKCFYYLSDEDDRPLREVADEEMADDQRSHHALHWLIRKASFTARGASIKPTEKSVLLQTSIFKWFAAMCHFLPADDLTPFMVPILTPLYYTVNHTTGKSTELDELRQLATEVMAMFRKKVSPTVYFGAEQAIRDKAEQKRAERKKRAVETPSDSATKKKIKWQPGV